MVANILLHLKHDKNIDKMNCLKIIWYITIFAGLLILGNQSVQLYSLYREIKKDYTIGQNEIIKNVLYDLNMKSSRKGTMLSYDAINRTLTYFINQDYQIFYLAEHEDSRTIDEISGYDIRDTNRWNLNTLNKLFQKAIGTTTKKEQPIRFVITDSTGRIKDTYQQKSINTGECNYITRLGYISGDTLQATYPFPFGYFLIATYDQLALIAAIMLLLILCISVLTQAIRQEKKKGEYREQFVHALVHDLKAPILNVLKIEYLLRESTESELSTEDRQSLDRSRDQLSKLLESIGRMLNLSTDAHGLQIAPTRINLQSMLEKFTDSSLWNVEQGKSFEIILDCQMENPIMEADYHFLYAVFQNLIENALKYSGKHINVHLCCQDSDHGNVRIEIEDNGFGISPEALKHVFERHYREKHHKKTIKGFGLGLNFVQTVIHAHRGTIEVESAKGKGSKFSIVLPRSSKNKKHGK